MLAQLRHAHAKRAATGTLEDPPAEHPSEEATVGQVFCPATHELKGKISGRVFTGLQSDMPPADLVIVFISCLSAQSHQIDAASVVPASQQHGWVGTGFI